MAKKPRRRPARALPAAVLRSSAGYRVVAQQEDGEDSITVTAPGGALCLRIRLLPDGPLVEVQSPALRLVATGRLQLDCQSLTVNAEREIALNAGTIRETAVGDILVRAGGDFESEAGAQRLRARLGGLDFEANDDVSLEGERILLNTPVATGPAPQLVRRSRGAEPK